MGAEQERFSCGAWPLRVPEQGRHSRQAWALSMAELGRFSGGVWPLGRRSRGPWPSRGAELGHLSLASSPPKFGKQAKGLDLDLGTHASWEAWSFQFG